MKRPDLVPLAVRLEPVGSHYEVRVDMTNTVKGYIVVERATMPKTNPNKHLPDMRVKAEAYAQANGVPFIDKTEVT